MFTIFDIEDNRWSFGEQIFRNMTLTGDCKADEIDKKEFDQRLISLFPL